MENTQTDMTGTEIKLWAMKYAKEFCGKDDLVEFSEQIYQWLKTKNSKDSRVKNHPWINDDSGEPFIINYFSDSDPKQDKIDLDKIIKEQIHTFGTKDLNGLVKSCIKVLLEKSKIDKEAKQ